MGGMRPERDSEDSSTSSVQAEVSKTRVQESEGFGLPLEVRAWGLESMRMEERRLTSGHPLCSRSLTPFSMAARFAGRTPAKMVVGLPETVTASGLSAGSSGGLPVGSCALYKSSGV